jgi:hypothetical protein
VPSGLLSSNPAFLERDRAKAESMVSLQTLQARGPFMGYVPDLPTHLMNLNFAWNCNHIIARALTGAGGEGEALMVVPGWVRVDNDDPATSLPLGHSSSLRKVLLLAEFPRTSTTGGITGEHDKTLMAWTGGDGSTENTAALWRVALTSNDWERVQHINVGGAGVPHATALRPKGGRNNMPHSCTFAAGASARTAYSAGIAEPAFIFTNNVDPVYVYPSGTGVHNRFEDLTDDANLRPFFAKSCAVFNNRVYFLNTSEAGVRRRQRLRRTPPFTCDPKTSAVGAGPLDLRDYTGDGVRVERLGSVLAVYFTDGVAFLRATGNYTAPDAVQTVSTTRGLISTNALANIGNDTHFGIFNDGWFELDPSGRWNERGVVDVGGGVVKGKWKETFYNLLAKDPTKRERLFVQYEPSADYIYISFPTDAEGENSRVWIYDRKADRVWIDDYEALCFGTYDRLVIAGMTYATSAPHTYSSIAPATYASLGPQYSLKALAHGNSAGWVFQHEPDSINRDNSNASGSVVPTFTYQTHYIGMETPRYLKTADRVEVEYIGFGAGGSNVTANVRRGVSDSGENGVLQMMGSPQGDIVSAKKFFRRTGQVLSLTLSGSAPIILKSYELDLFNDQSESYT